MLRLQPKKTMIGKSLNGYVHEVMIHDQFTMTFLMEEQLEALHSVPVDDRILHFDATGGLVKAKGDGIEYGQIPTYALIAQIYIVCHYRVMFTNTITL